MSNRLNGAGSLNYMGVNATQPPNLITMDRRPTVTDGVGMPLGTIWLIPQAATGITPQKEVWQLVGNRQNVYRWKHLRGSSGPTPEPFAISVSVYDTPGSYTYTPTDGTIQVTVECVGGGGGSAGWGATGAGATAYLNGGSGAAYCKKTFTAAQVGSSQAFVVGAGGAAGGHGVADINPGGNGGSSTFGSFLVAGGGIGSTGNAALTALPENFGGVATGGDINVDGQPCPTMFVIDVAGAQSGRGSGGGGSSGLCFGFGGNSPKSDGGNQNGVAGTGYGSGAGGVITASNASVSGAAGSNGVVIITEYL